MTIKLNQIYSSKVAHRSFDGAYCNLFLIPDKRKGSAFGPNGERIMLNVHQRNLLEPVELLLHNLENRDAIKQKMIGNILEVHEFPDSVKRSGFGAGLIVNAQRGETISADDVISVIESDLLIQSIKPALDKHNEIVMVKMNNNTVAATP